MEVHVVMRDIPSGNPFEPCREEIVRIYQDMCDAIDYVDENKEAFDNRGEDLYWETHEVL
jgi:hypothetical protein